MIGKDLEGSGCGLVEVLTRHFAGGLNKSQRNTSLRISDVQAEIRTKRLQNTSLDAS
jgi:hypothetical protein